MVNGISSDVNCASSAACLVSNGLSFVVRYHSRTTQLPEKRLTPKEAAELARAGLDIVTVYQDRAREPGDFGWARGVQDAQSAMLYAGQVGQPAGSGLYFAVDFDFYEPQLRSVVVPYFQAVSETLAKNGGNYVLGVYGSGLTCRLLKQVLSIAKLAWVAESRIWQETETYTGWDIKQHVNKDELCSIGSEFERCEAQQSFGQFKPVGYDITAGAGADLAVSATSLGVRFSPSAEAAAPIAHLPQGTLVSALGTSAPGWTRISATLSGADLIGHVETAGLAPTTADDHALAALTSPTLPAVHLAQNNPSSSRALTTGRAYPLGEPGRPGRTAVDAIARCEELTAIGDWLNSPVSPRYQPDGVTFCNVYAADYCYLAGVYLPRVWWKDKAIASILGGTVPPVAYDQTVREMRADDLCEWLTDYGAQFGWRRVFDETALQNAANAGGIGVICADREAVGKPGHISVVVPENGTHKATRDADNHVVQPLQSQAGGKNYRYGSAGPTWWRGAQFKAFVFFVHD
jgi:hypothetical protein